MSISVDVLRYQILPFLTIQDLTNNHHLLQMAINDRLSTDEVFYYAYEHHDPQLLERRLKDNLEIPSLFIKRLAMDRRMIHNKNVPIWRLLLKETHIFSMLRADEDLCCRLVSAMLKYRRIFNSMIGHLATFDEYLEYVMYCSDSSRVVNEIDRIISVLGCIPNAMQSLLHESMNSSLENLLCHPNSSLFWDAHEKVEIIRDKLGKSQVTIPCNSH